MIERGNPLRPISWIAVVCVLQALTAHGSAAQEILPPEVIHPTGDLIRPGARVRLSLQPARERILGLLIRADEDTIVVNDHPGNPARAVPVDAVRSFEVSRGQKSRAGRGAVIGLLSGAAGGVAAGLIVCDDGDCLTSGEGDLKGLVSTVLGVGGGLFGAGIGALVGGRFHSERWERVPLKDLRMGLQAREDGALFRLSLRFR